MQEIRKKIKEVTEKVNKAGQMISDPQRPVYHFHAPAQWMDDPNGIIYHKGWYHMMYSLNPDTYSQRAGVVYRTESSEWGPENPDWTGGRTVWGHARSRDMVRWEHLPIAIYPQTDKGEHFIWFGCTAINGNGIPVAIYTSVGYERSPTDSAEQWMWCAEDDELINWYPFKDNPLMTEEIHGGKKMWEWRDPFVFKHKEKAYIICGAKQDKSDGGRAVVLLYEARNDDWTKWDYRGVLFEHPDVDLRGCECPNIARLGDKWALILSPFGPVEYFIGDIDFETATFTWEQRGKVDCSQNFYASNILYDGKDRCLMWGAIEGFSNTIGWNGINSLPRHIWLNEAGDFCQDIPSEISTLRKGENVTLNALNPKADFESALLELEAELDTISGAVITVSQCDKVVKIHCRDGKIIAGDYEVLVQSSMCNLRLFIDKSVIEIIVDKRECISLVIPPLTKGCSVALEARSEKSTLSVWVLDAYKLFTYYQEK